MLASNEKNTSKEPTMNVINEDDDFHLNEPICLDEDPDETTDGHVRFVEHDDDDESSTEDEDAHLKNINPGLNGGFKALKDSRNYSMVNFLTRSERNHLMGKDRPPSPEDARKRQVKFDDGNLEVVHEVPIVPEELKELYWLNYKDFDRFDTEVKLTTFRWENHLAGRIKFNEDENSIRGLETTLGPKKRSEFGKWQHSRNVMEEINRQKLAGATNKTLDWEKIREVARICSDKGYEKAVDQGKRDELDRRRVWGEDIEDHKAEFGAHSSKPTESSGKKKKSKKFKFFWQKK